MKLFGAILGLSKVSAFDVNEHVEGYCKATEYVNAHPGPEYIINGKVIIKSAGNRWICGLKKPSTFMENVFVNSVVRTVLIINCSPWRRSVSNSLERLQYERRRYTRLSREPVLCSQSRSGVWIRRFPWRNHAANDGRSAYPGILCTHLSFFKV